VYDSVIEELVNVGGYLATEEEKAKLRAVMWDDEGHRLPATVAIAPQDLAETASFTIPNDRKFIIVNGDKIGKQYPFSGEKLTTKQCKSGHL
jgi:sulfoacetaldehyde dehydrogenase